MHNNLQAKPSLTMSNFRPITMLNTIGKILERLFVKQFWRHSSSSLSLGQLQSAYLALHSTDTAMTKFVLTCELVRLYVELPCDRVWDNFSQRTVLYILPRLVNKVVTDLVSAVDSGESSMLLSLDISAAFYTGDAVTSWHNVNAPK